jgi:HEAT repeat protein
MNLRALASCSLFVCAAASAASAQENGLARPSITTAVVRPDTVWFCGNLHGIDNVLYYFARQTRAWGQSASQGSACDNVSPFMGRDTIDAGRGVRILRIVSTMRDADNDPIGRSYLRVVDSARGWSTDILRRLDPGVLARLPKVGGMEGDSVSTIIDALAIDDSTLWLGLRGGFPEGGGEFGGLFRVDRRSGTVDWINDPSVVTRDITGIADAGRWLIIGAVTVGEYGRVGGPGLLRYDKTNGRWHVYGDSVPLPDKLIRTLRGDGQLIAVATEMGLAVVDLARDNSPGGDNLLARWSSTWFVPAFVGDSMTYRVGQRDQTPRTPEAEAPWIFAQRYAAVGHERPFYAAIAALPHRQMMKAVSGYGEDSRAAALADTSLLPLLTKMLGRPESQRIAALAFARLGTRSPAANADALRRDFLAGGRDRTALARALRAVGDSTPIRWARSILDSAVRAGFNGGYGDEIPDAATILAEARDRVGMGLVIAIAGDGLPQMSPFMSGTLAMFDDPAAWGALFTYAKTGKLKAQDVVRALRSSALNDPIVHERARAFVRENLGVDSVRGSALEAMRNLGMIEFAPLIIDRLSKLRAIGFATGADEAETLVWLSGRSDAPIWADSLPPAEVHDWWQRWWTSTKGKATAVSWYEGRRAMQKWATRFFATRRRK